MPFTVSHVAAVLPVVGWRRTTRVAPAAWVIGSMVPDVAWFFTGGRRHLGEHAAYPDRQERAASGARV